MIKKDTKVAVLGAGAMGCLFGGLMAEKGLDVILIDVWKDHVDAINKKGLKMDEAFCFNCDRPSVFCFQSPSYRSIYYK